MKGNHQTARAAASLTSWLGSVPLSGLTARETTKLLTERTAQWGRRRGSWRIELEAPARITRTTKRGEYHGRLDLLCRRALWLPNIAIEIDRGNKRWSLQKLVAEAEGGNVALWVRWRGPHIIEVPDNVGLVDIRETALSADVA